MNVPLENLITSPLSEFMFVVRNLWLEESFSNDFEYAQEKIKKLVDILDLGGEATIIDFAQHKLDVKKLEKQKIKIEKGKQNGVMTFREVKLINHSELTRLQMIHLLLQKFNDNNHIQMAAYEKEVARLKAENEELQLLVRLHQDEIDGHESEGEDWKQDQELEENGMVFNNRSPYIEKTDVPRNPYCITIATKRKLDEFQCEVWTLPELLRLNRSRLVEEFHKWREAGFAPSSPPSVIWDGLIERFIHHYVRYYEVNEVIELWDTAWTEYWSIVALFGKPKEIPQKLIENQSELPNGQGLISSNANADHLTENDFLLGTQDNFMKFIHMRCAPVED